MLWASLGPYDQTLASLKPGETYDSHKKCFHLIPLSYLHFSIDTALQTYTVLPLCVISCWFPFGAVTVVSKATVQSLYELYGERWQLAIQDSLPVFMSDKNVTSYRTLLILLLPIFSPSSSCSAHVSPCYKLVFIYLLYSVSYVQKYNNVLCIKSYGKDDFVQAGRLLSVVIVRIHIFSVPICIFSLKSSVINNGDFNNMTRV